MTARDLAIEALVRVDDGAFSNLLLPTLLRGSGLDGRDRAFATDLVYSTLRQQRALDHLLGPLLSRPVDGLDPDARAALRVGAYQLRRRGRPACGGRGDRDRDRPEEPAGEGIRQRGPPSARRHRTAVSSCPRASTWSRWRSAPHIPTGSRPDSSPTSASTTPSPCSSPTTGRPRSPCGPTRTAPTRPVSPVSSTRRGSASRSASCSPMR